ncbi:molybdopterin-dependent oxidoreductase [Burkholderia ubonensis]|uniref:Molybdopterin-binding protein n=1 Tax=Burkholderia ubonensis subsp. mesacidophila TaxID=265293 RepID=A0A2A4FEA8_9BURK|nr:molybdopterin-dependent oxidoreductase [Burkholderia ubonensis]PCE30766.1 molybdopterin-binding protein [Burkholderia ubonensis subsp. mesacidophila]
MGTAEILTAIAEPAYRDSDGVVHVSGDVIDPLSISVDELRRRANVTVEPFELRCFRTHRFIRAVDRYRGMRLTDLISRAGLRCDQPGDFKRMVFLAVGQDGYTVTFSWHELFNTAVGEQVIVACECGGRPLDAADGAPVLFSGADVFAAPRHVNRLARVIARVLAP